MRGDFMKNNDKTNSAFFLKITCLFILLGLGFINPKNYLNQGKKEISMAVKSSPGFIHLTNHIWVIKK
jgi:hypothetical protein